ncbi:probable glutamate receptor [Periplaneta americana]|uniref:probable glutamate receptor n=1 Tax=Periplaneta americana TaxID=6978 RepID=UPI0037E9125D
MIHAITIVLLVCGIAQGYLQEQLAMLFTDVIQHFYSGCVYLCYFPEQGTAAFKVQEIVKLQKIMSQRSIHTTAISLTDFPREVSRLQCNSNSPVYIILSDDVTSGPFLTQLQQELSGPVWLLVLPPGLSPGVDLLSGVNIPLDCEFLVVWSEEGSQFQITEVYRVWQGGLLHRFDYGSWSPSSGSTGWPDLELWKRRSGLDGILLHGTSIQPYNKEKDGSCRISGYIGDMWQLLEELMDFKTNITPPVDMAWGSINNNGDWNGMVALLQKHQVDVAINAFMMTSERSDVMDFTTPIHLSKFFMFVQEPRAVQSDWRGHIRPFTGKLWGAVLVMMVLMAVSLSVSRTPWESTYTLYDAFFCVIAIITQQGLETTPFSTPRRMILVTSCLTSVVLVGAYSATLTSFLTIQKLKLPFADFQGLLKSNYELDVLEKSGEYNFFTNSKSPLIQEVYHRKLEQHETFLPSSAEQGLLRVCALKTRTYLCSGITAWPFLQQVNCSLVAIPADMFKATAAFGFVKNSPYRGIANYYINQLRSSGILYRLVGGSVTATKTTKIQLPQVEFDDVYPVLLALSLAIVMAILVLGLEFVLETLVLRWRIKATRSKKLRHTITGLINKYIKINQ